VLTHPTLDQLNQLGLPGMAQAFAELEASGDAATLSHADWLGLLLDREATHRRDKGVPPSLNGSHCKPNMPPGSTVSLKPCARASLARRCR